MIPICLEIFHKDSDIILQLFNSNDSVLRVYSLKDNFSSVDSYRQLLWKLLVKKIPGKVLYECIIYNWLWKIIPLVILIFGSVGNLLAAMVLYRKSMSNISSYIYLGTLTIVDQIILLTGLLRKYIEYIVRSSIENKSIVFCKLFQIIGVSSSFLSVWLIVTLTFERVLIIKRPFQASKYSKSSRAKYVIMLLSLISMGISSHFFETVTLIYNKDSLNNSTEIYNTSSSPKLSSVGECGFKLKYKRFANIWFYIDGALYSWLPVALLIVTNIVITLEILKASKTRNLMLTNIEKKPLNTEIHNDKPKSGSSSFKPVSHSTGSALHNSKRRETKQLTIMLLIVSISFLLTTSPLVILKLVLFSQSQLNYQRNRLQIARLELIDAICEMLMYINHAINFYLYCATGNKFRSQLVCLFRCSGSSQTYAFSTASRMPINRTKNVVNNKKNDLNNTFQVGKSLIDHDVEQID